MAILVLSHPLPAQPFAQALRALAGNTPVWTEDDVFDPRRVEAVLAWRLKPGILPRYPGLRVLCSTGAGVDKLMVADLPPALPVTRVVDPLQAVQLAQYVVACTLRFTRELSRYETQQAHAQWRRHLVRPPNTCRVGVLGLGAVGRAIARAFVPLGFEVAGWTRRTRELPGVQVFAGRAQLGALLARSDVLVNALPLTPDTHALLDRGTLGLLPRGAFLVNVGRGEHVVEPDLRALLDEDHLGGAALDVFEHEPPAPDNWVWTHPKVLATPHIAAQAAFETVAAQCLEALQRARAGSSQPRAVDREAGY
jgi:D-3-phosphoglycerate dehydrogenase/glyoxylate/hydroxypyruvate reductase A